MASRARRERAERLIAAFVDAPRAPASLVIALLLAAGTLATFHSGGTKGPVVHVMYLPVLVAATRFGGVGAVITGIGAGILVGPTMPIDVSLGAPQATLSWLIRLGFFVFMGQAVAVLSRESALGIVQRLADSHAGAELERAIARGEIQVVYQPQFDLATGRLIGAEALARWSRDGEAVAPDEFVALAERTGTIGALDDYILQEATAQLARWQRAVPDADLHIAVNVSMHDLADDDLPDRVARAVKEAGIAPEALHLELTESAVVGDIDLAVTRVDQLQTFGAKVAIDDFGTGQSSLAYLHRFRADVIKLDRSFVRAVSDERVRALVGAVVTLAEALGASTIAEGIETEDDADIIRSLGFQAGQGYYYLRPSPAEVIDRILAMALPWPSESVAPSA